MSTESNDGAPDMHVLLQRLEHRLTQLETRLQNLEARPPAAAPIRKPATFEPDPVPAPIAHDHAPSEIPPPPPPVPQLTPPPLVLPPQYRPSRSAAFVATHTAPRPVTAKKSESLESKIGRQWGAWVGGLFVLAAVLYFLKLAYDAGWLNPSPATRIALALAAGVALVVLGEWLHSRKMAALSASLVGTGLAVLMATMFAANVAFAQPVLSTGAAFAGVIIIGAAGIAISLQMRMMALAVLALIGMYISPLILNTGQDKSLELLLYIGAVTAYGLAVSFFKRNWWGLRGVAFAAGWLWVFAWAAGMARNHGELGRLAVGGFFALFLVEMIGSLMRVMGPPKNPDAPERPASPNTVYLENGAAILSLANTALAMGAFAIVYAAAHLEGLWMVALGLAGVMGIITFVTPSKPFTISTGIQALALVVLAVPLYFEHSAITFAWAILGLALALYSYATDSKGARVWMFVMLLLVALRLFLFDSFNERLHQVLFSVGSEGFTGWMLMTWGAALYSLLLGWLVRAREIVAENGTVTQRGEEWLTRACFVLGTIFWSAAAVSGLHSGDPLTLAEALWVLVAIGAGVWTVKAEKAMLVETAALVVLVLTAMKWALNDGIVLSIMGSSGLGDVHGTRAGVVMPILNLFVLNGILLAAAIALSRALRPMGLARRGWWLAAMAFVAINVEMLKAMDAYRPSGAADPWIAKNVALSVLWGLLGLGGVLVGFRRKIAEVRWAALVLLGITVAKVLLVDMANVETLWRVLSFLALGIVLLLVSFVYHKVGAVLLRDKVESQKVKVAARIGPK